MHRTKQRTIGDDDNRLREYAAMPGRLFAMKFNKDGSLFVAGSSLDSKGEVRVYKTDDGKEVSKLTGVGSVYTVAFAPDGKTVASAGFDGEIVLSDPNTGKVTKKFAAVPLARSDPPGDVT
jgi:WD40 repeat protein